MVTSLPNQRINNNHHESVNKTSINKSPYWEYILREFVSKTISSPPLTSVNLHKKLLEAPFYGGPLPTTSNKNNTLLSRGNVYHLLDGQWILCQDNCIDCPLCQNQKNSIVKWILRRVKRFISANSYRYDLQLTVLPQLNDGTLKNFHTGNYVYVPYESMILKNATVNTRTSHVDRSRSGRSWRRLQRDEHGQMDHDKNLNTMSERLNISSISNHQDNTMESKNIFKPTHRLIMGIDQLGKKHVIHVASIGPSMISNNNDTINYQSNRNVHELSYQQYVNKLLQSINSHRPIIKAFLSYNRINNDSSTSSFYPIYSEFIDNKNDIMKYNNTEVESTSEIYNINWRKRDWSQILTRMPRNKNYIPELIKKFKNNATSIIRSKSINLF
ncbi:hypothetical protein PV327_003529 [Microctonus hyperodae]|uniref:Uncharacterized protein n=1 Tax=Microctonus hyperodae TaxID=165561 RepID=A0AA39L1A1_MICHY|nr:hypothetical protein PV327_003529 [Microctonus hyperodae]